MRLLLTDILLLFIVVVIVLLVLIWRKKPTWIILQNKLAKNFLAKASIVILILYFFVAILDSIHLKKITIHAKNNTQTEELKTVLEILCKWWLPSTETTYSQPFSTHSFSKENIPIKNDPTKFKRDFPPLQNVKVGNQIVDILKYLLLSLFYTGIFILCIVYLYSFYKKKSLLIVLQDIKKRPFSIFLLFVLPLAAIIILVFSSIYHILGTNKAGFDVFYVSLKSIRTAMIIGLVTTLIVTPLAILFGVLAGYFGGVVDDVIQFIYTTLEAIPSILLIAAVMLIVDTNISTDSSLERADTKLFFLCAILGITSWTNLCRLLRAETLKVRELDFIMAAKAMKISTVKILSKHIIPNVIHIVLITMILRFSGLVLSEAVLTYVGIGVDPSINSWGNMIDQARFELARSPIIWWNLASSFCFMLLLVLSANILGDVVRDALDPKLKSE